MQNPGSTSYKKANTRFIEHFKNHYEFSKLETSPSFGRYINDFYTLNTLRNLTVKCCLLDFYEGIHDVCISLICCHVTDFLLIIGEKVWNINILIFEAALPFWNFFLLFLVSKASPVAFDEG